MYIYIAEALCRPSLQNFLNLQQLPHLQGSEDGPCSRHQIYILGQEKSAKKNPPNTEYTGAAQTPSNPPKSGKSGKHTQLKPNLSQMGGNGCPSPDLNQHGWSVKWKSVAFNALRCCCGGRGGVEFVLNLCFVIYVVCNKI